MGVFGYFFFIRVYNYKVTHVSSCQKLKLILQPGKPAEVTFSIHLDFSANNH